MVLRFAFRIVICFELIFVKGVNYVSRHVFACRCPDVPESFVKMILNFFFIKKQLMIFVSLFLSSVTFY
jgi:hypothetical protein